MLSKIFSSKTRVKLLTLFLLRPSEEFFVRELTRKTGEQINSVRRELENLTKIGFLTHMDRARKKYYRVDKSFMVFEELQALFRKMNNAAAPVLDTFGDMDGIDAIYIAGKLVGNAAAPLDLLVIGRPNREKLYPGIQKLEKNLNEELKYMVMDADDFEYRKKIDDRFLLSVMESDGVEQVKG